MGFDMEQYNQWPANHKHDKEPSKKIIALGKKITDRVDVKLGMTKLDANSPEYYGLASVVTDEMAELALAMECRCYHGGEGRTRLRELKSGMRDYIALAFTILLFAAVIVLNILLH